MDTEVSLTATADAMMREAAQLHRQNRVPEAIDAYRRVLARWPRHAESWFNLAVLQRQAHRFDEALESYQRALDAGASVVVPLEDQFWGDRYGVLADPFGHHWSLGQPVREVSADEIAAFTGQQPG